MQPITSSSRRTTARLAISASGNVKVIHRMLGHVSAAMTLDVDADLFDDDLEILPKARDGSTDGNLVRIPRGQRDRGSPNLVPRLGLEPRL